MINSLPTDNLTGGISPNNNGAKLVEYRLGNFLSTGTSKTLTFDVIPDYYHVWVDPNPSAFPAGNTVQVYPLGYIATSAPSIMLGCGGYVKIPGRTQSIAIFANSAASVVNVVATMNCDFVINPVQNS